MNKSNPEAQNMLLQLKHNRFLQVKGRVLFVLFLLFLLLTSCADQGLTNVEPLLDVTSDAEKGLTNARRSIEELCNEILERIAKNDIKSLEAMALTEDEFKRYYWPLSEWSRPEVRMPFEYYWGDLRQKSNNSLRRMLASLGGKKFEFVHAYFGKETMEFTDAKVNIYRDSHLIVDNEQGEEQEIEVFGSIIEVNGQYKIFSYIYKN
jgi:hypothetical protein